METHLFAAKELPRINSLTVIVAICGKVLKPREAVEFAVALEDSVSHNGNGVCFKCLVGYMKKYRAGSLKIFAFGVDQ